MVRSHLFDSRVKGNPVCPRYVTQCLLSSPLLCFADIHYAASHNNYPKLLFYTQKYPEMLNELDHEGNTALHSAAK